MIANNQLELNSILSHFVIGLWTWTWIVTNYFQARTSYNSEHSEPVSPVPGLLSPDHMIPGHHDILLHPVKSATFHKTTSAKKISTTEFRQSEYDELMMTPGAGDKSIRYESIVTLPQDKPLQPSPYVYRHRQVLLTNQNVEPASTNQSPEAASSSTNQNQEAAPASTNQSQDFVTHLNTEDYVTSSPLKHSTPLASSVKSSVSSLLPSMSSLTVSDTSQFAADRQMSSLSTFQTQQKVSREEDKPEEDTSQPRPSQPPPYQALHQPPAYQPTSHQSLQPHPYNQPLSYQPQYYQPVYQQQPLADQPLNQPYPTFQPLAEQPLNQPYQQPPSYKPPPPQIKPKPLIKEGSEKEDIKVIHFGIV